MKLKLITVPYALSWVALGSILVIVGLIVYATTFADNPPAVVGQVATFDQDAYYPGEEAVLSITLYERKAKGTAQVTVGWICDDGRLTRLDAPRSSQVSPPISEPVVINLVIKIRDDLPVGAVCYSTRTAVYKVNAFAPERSVTLTTTEFLVLPPPSKESD